MHIWLAVFVELLSSDDRSCQRRISGKARGGGGGLDRRGILPGRSLRGATGYSTIFRCKAGGHSFDVNAGWAERMPATPPPAPHGLQVGVLAPAAPSDPTTPGFYLETAAPPLSPSAPPTLDSIPNNHFSYAMQWFSFAAILAVIYGLWLRRWLAQRPPAA